MSLSIANMPCAISKPEASNLALPDPRPCGPWTRVLLNYEFTVVVDVFPTAPTRSIGRGGKSLSSLCYAR
jgi:hypothetical protein